MTTVIKKDAITPGCYAAKLINPKHAEWLRAMPASPYRAPESGDETVDVRDTEWFKNLPRTVDSNVQNEIRTLSCKVAY